MTHRKAFIRLLTGLFILVVLIATSLTPAVLFVQAAPHQAASRGDVVISEFRTSGPTGINDEFIELYNRSTNQVDISGWKINDSTSFGTTSLIKTIPSSTLLLSGQYYLIVNSGGYSGTVSPNLPYAQDIPDNGGIALLELDGITISDQVGMNAGSSYKEPANGSGILTPLSPGIDQSYERLPGSTQGGCTDTDNNASDFSLITITPGDPQNMSSPLGICRVAPAPTFTSTPTSTPTRTLTPTPTNTPNPACSLTPPPAYPSLALVINEVGWAGTLSSAADQWIEIYNPSSCPINLTNWYLQGQISGSIKFTIYLADSLDPTTDSIQGGGYFVLAVTKNVFKQNVLINQESSLLNLLSNFSTPGESLLLFGPAHELVDHANINGDSWPAGSTSTHASMERSGVVQDVRTSWVTYAGPTTNITDSGNNFVRGTPGRANWATTVTITPSPFYTPTKKPTPRPPTPFAHVVINEFLPRPGFDWNSDGAINVYDEFIEIENLGPINVNLSGWKLDNVSGGSHFYSLPARTLKPGERALYYGSITHIPLYDSGGTVRLINSRGIVVDARGYGIATVPDQSYCRIPDGDGYWRTPCFPTPGTENALTGTVPALPPAVANQPPACLLPDTVPDAFREAVCNAFGTDILNGGYWDGSAGQDEFPVQDIYNKLQTIIE
jgi:hypothetical protein